MSNKSSSQSIFLVIECSSSEVAKNKKNTVRPEDTQVNIVPVELCVDGIQQSQSMRILGIVFKFMLSSNQKLDVNYGKIQKNDGNRYKVEIVYGTTVGNPRESRQELVGKDGPSQSEEKNALVFLTIKGGDPTTFRIKSESAAGVVSEKDIESYLQKELNELKHENPTKELLNVLNGQLELKMVTETTVSDSAAVIKNEKAAS